MIRRVMKLHRNTTVSITIFLAVALSSLIQVFANPVVLTPHGNEFICSTSSLPISRVLNCKVSGTNLLWYISKAGDSPTHHWFTGTQQGVSNAPYNISGIVASLTTTTNDTISSELVIPNNQRLLPVVIKCGPDSVTQLMYSLVSKGPPEPPTNVSISKNCYTSARCRISWQAPESSSTSQKLVESYILTITTMSDPSHTRVITTTNTSVLLYLNDSTNFTISIKSSNCAGNSSEVVYEKNSAIQSASEASTVRLVSDTTTTNSTTILTLAMVIYSTRAFPESIYPTLTLQTVGPTLPVTSDTQLAIVGAVITILIITIIVITGIVGVIFCNKRLVWKTETSKNINSQQPNNKVDSCLYEDPDKVIVGKENIVVEDNIAYQLAPTVGNGHQDTSVDNNATYVSVNDFNF